MSSFRLIRADWKLLGTVLALTAIGLVMIYSATRAQLTIADQLPAKKLILQSIWVLLGLVLFVLVSSFDFSRLAVLSSPIYVTTLVLLVVVLIIGEEVRGVRRWMAIGPMTLQPAELVKLGLILMLAAFFASREGEAADFELLTRGLAYAVVPCVFLVLQPDLGTPILLLFVWGGVAYIFGARLHHLGAFFFAFIMVFMAAWGFGLIRPHQKQRLTAFISNSTDIEKEGYHLRQSLIAIGSGHLAGQGLFRGPQTQLSFVPDQETDFIFTAVGEEFGFLGCGTVILLFGVVLWRGLMICAQARTLFGQLVAAGIVVMLFFHVAANIGMTLGMMPVKGLPLPFVSYGGSSVLTNFIALGLLQAIYNDRRTIRFE